MADMAYQASDQASAAVKTKTKTKKPNQTANKPTNRVKNRRYAVGVYRREYPGYTVMSLQDWKGHAQGILDQHTHDEGLLVLDGQINKGAALFVSEGQLGPSLFTIDLRLPVAFISRA